MRSHVCLVAAALMCLAAATPLWAKNDKQADDSHSAKHSDSTGSFHGTAHWYGGQFHGRRTASGAVYDKMKFTCAHPSLPFGTKVRVTSAHTGKHVIVEVNDRCPALKVRCIDISEGAARKIGIYPTAPGHVHCEVLGKGKFAEEQEQTASAAVEKATKLAKNHILPVGRTKPMQTETAEAAESGAKKQIADTGETE